MAQLPQLAIIKTGVECDIVYFGKDKIMAVFGQLRNEFFKYRKRKRKSLDGSVPGANYNHFRRPTTRPLGAPYRGGAYHQKSYLGDLPSEYHPNINAPAVQGFDYEKMETWDLPVNGTTLDMQRPTSLDLSEMPPHLFPTAEDDLNLEEQFLMNMGIRPRPQEGPIPVELDEIRHLLDGVRGTIHGNEATEGDVDPRIARITDALSVLEDVLPEDHPDIINLRTALQILGGQVSDAPLLEGAESASGLLEHDPVAEAQQIFDQQMQELNQAFELPAFMQTEDQSSDGFDEQQALLDQMLELTQSGIPFMEQDSLEQIVEQADPYGGPQQPLMEPEMMPGDVPSNMGMSADLPNEGGYDLGMIHDEINQAIDQVSGQPIQQGPMPEQPTNHAFDPMEEDPWELQRYMYDPYMQQLMNPYMTLGPMGFGPMGPMGPMPGP